jgi:hypothetical protein
VAKPGKPLLAILSVAKNLSKDRFQLSV